MSGNSIDEVDVLAMSLMRDLATLDSMAAGDDRLALIRAALEHIARLLELGGGSLGEARLQAVQAALHAELSAG